jgi:hypothetical protein
MIELAKYGKLKQGNYYILWKDIKMLSIQWPSIFLMGNAQFI